ncbi:S-adenosyl-L-methionine-dependent methyltransferase [Paraphoma chrysanthemicola]|nr:S-adenosyl-L-methionine-dependent methyltransferase [Paraphoma chrysanthemicola]
MSVSLSGPCLPPSSSLPPIRQIISASELQIITALRNLQTLYCPLRLPSAIPKPTPKWKHISAASTPSPVDSGYVSRDENQVEDSIAASEEVTAALRADPFERTFATRWLTSLLARVEEMDFEDDVKSSMIDDAAFILSSFSDSANEEEEEALTRDFLFPTRSGDAVKVTLNDAPLSGTDHTDVGLQSWGASIVLSSMMCANPEQFGLTSQLLGEEAKVIELGAGTGLVSLTLARFLPESGAKGLDIAATDYHPAVLDNCQANIATNFPENSNRQHVRTMLLDWSQPPADLHATADMLIASDVVYAPEHAAWLRDCAAHLLKPGGIFWLMVTVRKTGKFEGIPETAEAAFKPDLCPRDESGRTFQILEKQWVEKRRGIGRGDETGYQLYRIGWA